MSAEDHYITELERDNRNQQTEIERLRAELERVNRLASDHAAKSGMLESKAKQWETACLEARRLLDEARKQEPVAWAYCFSIPKRHDDTHDNDEFSEVVYRTHRELSADAPFGRRGYDFDESADTTETPLYAAPVPAQPAVPDDVAKDAACWKQLTLAHKFNNHPVVGFAINRAKEKAAILSAADDNSTATEGRKDE